MPNRLFDRWEMRPKPLRTQVELGPAFTMRQCVNEVPSLVFFKRQATLRTGMQHRTRTPLTTQPVLRLIRHVALQKPSPSFAIFPAPVESGAGHALDRAIESATTCGSCAEALDSGEKAT
jgi:hypothetical protein